MDAKKFVVGVDLDGVVSDFVHDIRPHAAEWFGVPVESLSEHPDYNFSQWGNGLPDSYPMLHWFAVTQRGLFIKSNPIKDAPQVLRRLSDAGVHIRIITSRICISGHHAEIVRQTVDWLERHGIPYWDICFVKDKLSVNADLYVEDSPSNVEKLKRFNRRVLMYKTSVNKGTNCEGADNWKDLEQLIMREKKLYGEI